MDKKYQIFISSTYIDLVEQRQAVLEAILRMGHLPVGMERFDAADESQWEVIKRHIDNSDYYVLIIARRYGSEDPVSGLSYTHKEYRYALETGVPCIAFMLDDSVKIWNNDHVDTGKTKKKLDAFKAEFKNRLINFWQDPKDLAYQTYASLSTLITRQPGVGWVRGTEATSPHVAEEMSRLSKENNELKLALAAQGAKIDEVNEAEDILKKIIISTPSDFSKQYQVTQFELFDKYGDLFLGEVASTFVSSKIKELFRQSTSINNPSWIKINIAIPLIKTLATLELIQGVSDDDDMYWTLSSKGRKLLSKLRHSSLS